MIEPLLDIHGLRAGYRRSVVLQRVDLAVQEGQVVALLGRNGVGKTTLVHAIMGLVQPSAGSIRFGGQELSGRTPDQISRGGIALVPQGRRIFSRLSVEENLRLAHRSRDGRHDLDSVYELLPRLYERRRHRGRQLSGGEQQMLAIGRALLANARLVLFDEPSEGLAPKAVDQIAGLIAGLREHGLSALLVEQNLHVALSLADAVTVMTKGEIVYRATADVFRADPETARAFLGVG
ncbi:MAG: ABC transporter ATP-binding protein [Gaiellaceae bacterium MAG52_C11]|nr:ABC transporter ATP-binding protein [Candidatus Gaiellasilicea maunaloa]